MAYRGAHTDRISHLPIEIIHKILNLLSCRDAVRTSILSSDWRYKWISMSDLNFGKPWSTAARHAKFIHQCLLRHQGPIRKFSVTSHTLTVQRKIEQFLEMESKHDIEIFKVLGKRVFPRFPSCLLKCKKLTHLEMSIYMMDVPPTFEGFPNLKALKLKISMADRSSIESLISKSPLLKCLKLEGSMCSNIAITISAPKVKYLSMHGHFKDIFLENSPVLVDMRLTLFGDQIDSCLIKILSAAPNLEKLAVNYISYCPGLKNFKCFKIGCYWGVLSTTVSYLKVMNLFGFYLGKSEAIPLVLKLLRSAPNLEKLVIYNADWYVQKQNADCYPLPNQADSDFWQKEYLVGHCFMKLKVVEMGYILCMAPEIEFAKFILSNSPVLEKMTIATREWKQAIITRMLKNLPKLPRASAQVAVTFHYGNSEWRPKL